MAARPSRGPLSGSCCTTDERRGPPENKNSKKTIGFCHLTFPAQTADLRKWNRGERPGISPRAQAGVSQCQESVLGPQVMNRVIVDRLHLWAPEEVVTLGSLSLVLCLVACCSSRGSTHHQRGRDMGNVVKWGKTTQFRTGVVAVGARPTSPGAQQPLGGTVAWS